MAEDRTLSRGSGSHSRRSNREDDELHIEGTPTPHTPQTPRTPQTREEERVYLSSQEGGVWWDDKRIVDFLGRSFTDTYNEYVTNWSEASPSQRDAMYNYFANRVRTDPGYDLRTEYERRIKTRITVPINRVAKTKKKPGWMPDECFARLLKRHEDKEWQSKASKAKANRLKGGKDGKAPPTSTLGQQSAARVFSKLGKDEKNPHQLMLKSKKNKKGEWITPRAEKIDAEYQRLKAQHDPSGRMTDSAFKMYLEAAGGFNNKIRVFGLGDVARQLFVPPTTSTRSSSSSQTAYTPSLISQYASKNAELEERLTQLQRQADLDRESARLDRERARAMEAKLAEQFGWTFDVQGTCSSGPRPGPRDDFPDGGSGLGGLDSQPIQSL